MRRDSSGITPKLEKFVQAFYEGWQGEDVDASSFTTETGASSLAQSIAEARSKDRLLERDLVSIEFTLENVKWYDRTSAGGTLAVYEKYEQVLRMSDAEATSTGYRKHDFELVTDARAGLMISGHQSTRLDPDQAPGAQAAVPVQKKTKPRKPKKAKPSVSIGVGDAKQLILIALAAIGILFGLILLIPYKSTTEVALETATQRTKTKVLGITISSGEVSDPVATWAEQNSVIKQRTWVLVKGKKGPGFGRQLAPSPLADDAIKVIHGIHTDMSAAELLAEYQKLLSSRQLPENFKELSANEKAAAMTAQLEAKQRFAEITGKYAGK